MRLALEQARLAASAGEVPVGAVLVGPSGGSKGAAVQVLACTHNQPIASKDPTAHAEMLALREAAQRLGNYRLDACELYVTLEPCAMCAQAMLHARIKRVVFGAKEPKIGAAGSVVDLFGNPLLNHQTQIQGGVLEQECVELLQTFFQERRRTKRAHAEPLRDDALRAPDACFAEVLSHFPQWRDSHNYHRNLPELNGLRLHTLGLGPKQVDAHLFLHSPGLWWPQGAAWALARLAANDRVLLPDLIGHGQSDKPKKASWHSLGVHARVLLGLLDACGVKHVHLAVAPGQMQLARMLASEAPQRVLSLQQVGVSELSSLSVQWLRMPFPDAGHQAAKRAWKSNQWDLDSPALGQ